MPFVYSITSAQVFANFQTSGTPNTEIDSAFLTFPGASRACGLIALRVQGKGAGLTALSGIAFRLKMFTSAGSTTGGTSTAPTPVDKRAPAAVFTSKAGTGGGTAAISGGSGGPTLVGGCGCGASGPGGWVAPNPDAAIVLDGGANMSLDLFAASGTASMNYEWMGEVQE